MSGCTLDLELEVTKCPRFKKFDPTTPLRQHPLVAVVVFALIRNPQEVQEENATS